ncbi:hypothetical protein CLV30_12071 [Haloactinopolyspora alba]|uniref:DUF6571 domain-containing protein n=1 Tax=Haloactinopolyspora alba TaxID=648780 RepID=A0A2P8DM59_9ACTN|nr:DUF6571 family protein [Haloactinopolyspora alba]PSK98285.1 hypothetical protein CLV30_12071 [Haloactinopolyspora alba]
MAMASIDLGHMADLVKALEDASTEVGERAGRVRYNLSDVHLSTDALNRVNGVEAWIDDQLPGVRRRLALARHVEAQEPGPQTFAEIDESKISTATPAEARERANDAAELMEDFDGGVPSQELVDLMSDNATDPYFAQQLAKKISPEKASEIVLGLSSARRVMSQYTRTRADLQEIEEFDSAYDSLLESMGTSLGLATQNTGDLALDDKYADRWLDAITDEQAMAGQASALGLVVSRGDWSTDFLTTLAQGVYDYEREYDQRGMWQQRASGGMSSQMYGAIDPVHGAEDGAPSGYTEYYDPLAGILDAVGRNPEAGHELFGSGNTVEIEADGEKTDVNAFMEYLIARRKWPVDDGAAAQSALATAMTPFEGGDVVSADIASDAQSITTMKAKEIEERRGDTNWLSEIGHLVLDGLGMVPVVGEPADAVNAIWYAAEGNVIDSGLSAAGMIPFLGWGATGGKWTRRALTADELAALRAADDAGDAAIKPNMGDYFTGGAKPKASELDVWAQAQGWTRSQTENGPLKFTDENGVVRMTIKRGSPRAPGSEHPHVEIRDETGQRTDPFGNPVTRKSPNNHTPIEWDW